MRMPQNWFSKVRRKFLRQSHKNISVLHSNACTHPDEAKAGEVIGETASYGDPNGEVSPSTKQQLTEEDIAAIQIQAMFRGHLARQACQALRSLVKLQALVRGVYVRKQARIAMHCMHALVRLQVRVRARQLLSRCSND